MRPALINGREALVERLRAVGQVAPASLPAEMPPYMESFLAHLRLLVGVPFEYFIPDPRLLPDESIRFFYLDRSWCDRLVDGAVSVGKIGSREQAHHQALAARVSGTLDVSERMVRPMQRGKDFDKAREAAFSGQPTAATLVTGFVMRSAAVSGWPHMEVRAYRSRIEEPFDASAKPAVDLQLPLLRLERLSAGVLFVLWQGVPELVTLEEPHHGVQFGIQVSADGHKRAVALRSKVGQMLGDAQDRAITVPLPARARHPDVIDVLKLRADLQRMADNPPATKDGAKPIAQTGPAAFAIAVLEPPWRQRFEGTEDRAGDDTSPTLPGFVVSDRVRKASLKLAVEQAYKRPE